MLTKNIKELFQDKNLDNFLVLIDSEGNENSFSYSELVKQASRWQKLYHDRGLKKGETIVIILEHSFDLYASFIGALIGNFVPVLFSFPSPKFSESEYFNTVDQLLENANAQLLVAYPELQAKMIQKKLKLIQQEQFCCQTELPESAEVIFPEDFTDPNAIAFLQYSSGTTGLKKGVAISHMSIMQQLNAYSEAICLRKTDVIVSWLPLYHDMGLVCCFLLPLIFGVKIVAMSPFDWVRNPGLWIKAVHKFKGTLSWQPNFAYSFLAENLKDDDISGIDLSSLRGLVNCSEPIVPKSHSAFTKRFHSNGFNNSALCTSYALAENTFAVTSGGFGKQIYEEFIDDKAFSSKGLAIPVEPLDAKAKHVVSSGQVLPGTDIEIVDEKGFTLPNRRVGEIVFNSPSLMSEYFRNQTATELVMKNGRYFSGDLGYLADNELFVTGRKKDLIIIGGNNVYPQDIEFLINGIEGIVSGRCVALGFRDDDSSTEALVVIAESEIEDEIHKSRLNDDIFRVISEKTSVVVSDIRIVPRKWLLKSTAGKISRVRNLEKYKSLFSKKKKQSIDDTCFSDQVILGQTSLVREAVHTHLRSSLLKANSMPNDDDPLISNGLIDSFGMLAFIQSLEKATGLAIPSCYLTDLSSIDSIAKISRTLDKIRTKSGLQNIENIEDSLTEKVIPMTYNSCSPTKRNWNFWTIYYEIFFRLKGIRFGSGIKMKGPVYLEISGDPSNISIGKNVTFMPGVHLKIRENGKITIHDDVKLDTSVRLVAANDAEIEIGERTGVGARCLINAGMDIKIGRGTLIAVNCLINASDHGYERNLPIQKQGYVHEPISIGDDVWLGASSMIMRGTRIRTGSIVSAQSLVRGFIPSHVVVGGSPARILNKRL